MSFSEELLILFVVFSHFQLEVLRQLAQLLGRRDGRAPVQLGNQPGDELRVKVHLVHLDVGGLNAFQDINYCH